MDAQFIETAQGPQVNLNVIGCTLLHPPATPTTPKINDHHTKTIKSSYFEPLNLIPDAIPEDVDDQWAQEW